MILRWFSILLFCLFVIILSFCSSYTIGNGEIEPSISIATEKANFTSTPIPSNTLLPSLTPTMSLTSTSTLLPTITLTPTRTNTSTITITSTISPNSPPEIVIIAPKVASVGSEIFLDASNSWDIDRDEFAVIWSQVFYDDKYSGATQISGYDAKLILIDKGIAKFIPEWPGIYRFNIIATDKDGEHKESIDVQVLLDDHIFEGRGISLEYWFYRNYLAKNAPAMYDRMIEDGSNITMISPSWYMESETATTMAPCPGETFKETCRGKIDEEELLFLIREAHARQLKVIIKPALMILSDENPYAGSISPTNWDEWFQNWTDVILHYAEIAEKEHVEYLQIGNELESSLAFTSKWKDLINEVRKVYSGKLSYSDNGFSYWGSQVRFWDELDYISVNFWGRASDSQGLPYSTHPSVEEMVSVLDRQLTQTLDPIARKYNLPVIITEFGTASYDGTNFGHFEYNGPLDNGEQASYYEACFRVFADRPFIESVMVWGFTFEKNVTVRTITMNPMHKPAEGVIKSWFIIQNP